MKRIGQNLEELLHGIKAMKEDEHQSPLISLNFSK
jgi:hypothetical protein